MLSNLRGPKSGAWTVAIWNKIGPDGLLDGWYGRACKMFSLAPGETRYIAFEENSQGGWAAAAGTSIPTDSYGGYASTWGEFDFGSSINSGWSGFDVSAIAAQKADWKFRACKFAIALLKLALPLVPTLLLLLTLKFMKIDRWVALGGTSLQVRLDSLSLSTTIPKLAK
jgi:hypothetical protein